jgi:putative SOS response-associated peptidase YedK
MPVIMAREHYASWLDPRITEVSQVLPLLQAFPPRAMGQAMDFYPVGTLVNNARVDEPRCITPLVLPRNPAG